MKHLLVALLAIGVLMGASSAKAEDGFDLSVVDFGDFYVDYDYPYAFDDYEDCEVVCEI